MESDRSRMGNTPGMKTVLKVSDGVQACAQIGTWPHWYAILGTEAELTRSGTLPNY